MILFSLKKSRSKKHNNTCFYQDSAHSKVTKGSCKMNRIYFCRAQRTDVNIQHWTLPVFKIHWICKKWNTWSEYWSTFVCLSSYNDGIWKQKIVKKTDVNSYHNLHAFHIYSTMNSLSIAWRTSPPQSACLPYTWRSVCPLTMWGFLPHLSPVPLY